MGLGSASGGSGSAATPPVNTVAPAITGTAETGQTLSCSTGTWTGTATITYAYQWKRDGANIGSATASTYLLVAADSGKVITCTVTATNGAGSASATSNSVTAFEAETNALAARFTTPPTSGRKLTINTLIAALKAGSVWSKLDFLHVMAAADTQAAERNWIADTFNLSTVVAPTFVADRGYTGNASSMYHTTGFNPTTAPSPKFVQNSGHLGVYVLTNVAQDGDDFGNGNSLVRSRSATNAFGGRVNQASTVSLAAIGTSIGHNVVRRPDAANIQHFKNGAQVNTGAVASAAPDNSVFDYHHGVGGYSSKQIAAGHLGQTLSDAEMLAFYNALNAYMVAVGAA